MPVKLKGATSGDITLDVPAVSGTNTLTLPARTGNIITSADSATVTPTMLSTGAPTWDASGNLSFNSGYGSSSTAYGCRAWVAFVGSSGTRNGNGNVSSVTRNAAGDYTINFSSAMPDTNYSVVCGSKIFATGGHQANDNAFLTIYNGATVLTGSVRVNMQLGNSNAGAIDPVLAYVAIFR